MQTVSLETLGLMPSSTTIAKNIRMIDETKLAEMLCTRLCHDLTGPIGAVNNGAEFLSEEGFDMQNEAMQLILSSAHEAVNRLQFYRQAYGRISDGGEASLSEKQILAKAFFSSTKITLDWPDNHADASGVSFSHKMARLLLNLLIIASASLIRGGTISVRVEETATAKRLHIRASGPTIKLDDEARAVLCGDDTAPLTPKLAQIFLSLSILREMDAALSLEMSEDSLSLLVNQPVRATASSLM